MVRFIIIYRPPLTLECVVFPESHIFFPRSHHPSPVSFFLFYHTGATLLQRLHRVHGGNLDEHPHSTRGEPPVDPPTLEHVHHGRVPLVGSRVDASVGGEDSGARGGGGGVPSFPFRRWRAGGVVRPEYAAAGCFFWWLALTSSTPQGATPRRAGRTKVCGETIVAGVCGCLGALGLSSCRRFAARAPRLPAPGLAACFGRY